MKVAFLNCMNTLILSTFSSILAVLFSFYVLRVGRKKPVYVDKFGVCFKKIHIDHILKGILWCSCCFSCPHLPPRLIATVFLCLLSTDLALTLDLFKIQWDQLWPQRSWPCLHDPRWPCQSHGVSQTHFSVSLTHLTLL